MAAENLLDQVTLTLDVDLLMDWSVKDIVDLETASGMSMPEWAEAMQEGRVSTRALRAWCWIENRRRWPNFKRAAVDEIPYGKFTDLILASNERAEQAAAEDDDEVLIEEEIVAEGDGPVPLADPIS